MGHSILALLLLVANVFALHIHSDHRSLSTPSSSWFHEDNHPTRNLFSRQTQLASVGSPTWSSQYPQGTPDLSQLPKAWTDALSAAVAAGKIPNIPVPASTGGNPAYPTGADPQSQQICSATWKCRGAGDIWDAPKGTIGIGFDDGPVVGSSDLLYSFLKSSSQKATHFMIGIAILQAPTEFLQAFNNGDDIAVHTYTHPYMTTLTNEELVAQFGWTMQIIYDSTGGRVPKFWRPPYGDMDNRVRAIASEVFGLTPILWNQDTEDWSLTTPGGTTPSQVASSLHQWITGPKSPGLIILEHELSNLSVSAFMTAYPTMKQNGWTTTSVAQISASQVDGKTGNVYWNAGVGNQGTVTSFGILGAGNFAGGSTAVASSTASMSSSASLSGNVSSTAVSSSTSIAATTTTTATTASPTPSAPASTSSVPTKIVQTGGARATISTQGPIRTILLISALSWTISFLR